MLKLFGASLLSLLAISSILGTALADFRTNHIFNPEWPAHARFHAAAFALMNMSLGAVALVLLWWSPFGWRESVEVVGILFAVMVFTFLAAIWVPGVTAVADKEERIWKNQPISVWMTMAFGLLTVVGVWLAIS